MKRNINKLGTVVACGLVVLGFTACDNEEFLNVTQYDIVDENAMFENDENAKMGMTGVYEMMQPDENSVYDGDWGFKPNLFTGSHPTIDTQATGWDKDWNVQNWNASSSELAQGWSHAYQAIARANLFLAGLESSTNVSDNVKKHLEGEARSVRAFFYHWLATTFGRVPMLSTGESYSTHPQKERAQTYAEMWDFIIEDLTAASDLLDWQPMDGEYGRATKGMALAYLGDAYMWKAYRCPEEATADYTKAAECFKNILDNGPYELSRSFTTNWDPAGAWNKETIWVEMLDEADNWSSWSNLTSKMFLKWYTACPENGGWGSLFLSWEWWSAYEVGDKRREASGYTGAVPQINPNDPLYDSKYEGWYVESVYGVNPYLQQTIGNGEASQTRQFHFTNGEWAPSIWSAKFWRTAAADWKAWSAAHWSPTPVYWKRLPNVMLDYAECLFNINGENDATAWGMINQLRNRAFGNLEVGHADELTAKYLPYYQSLATFYEQTPMTEYPLPFNTTTVTVPDAKEYYTALKSKKGFTSPVWKVAVNEERRKEFNCEWCIRPDLQKSGYLEDHVNHNYPKDATSGAALKDYPWTNREYDYNDAKMDMPIPADELIKNSLCDQNPAYL